MSETLDERQEDGWYDMLLLTGSRYPVRDNVHMMDDGGGSNILGETVGQNSVFGLWWTNGGRVYGGASENTA